MAVTSTRGIVNLKEKGHFERENARVEKYTLGDELPAQLSSLEIRPRKMSVPAYTIQRLTYNDRDLVLKFLRRFFFRDEPMNLAVNLLETPESRCTELDDYAAATLSDGVSVAAVDENGDYVGVIINGIVRRETSGQSHGSRSS
uniref:Arylalkylamine N-acetyltransferase short mutant n=1 Tax=Bombyx mori TaxID=7091 RepID=D6MKR1_BOMMO|nr:arylalkylamine N-acetyltransferase type 1 protein [Bombyx mori]ADQ28098.1 arylalkylamine N-acetyltransferase short mutant [Bombyx mori]